MLLAKSVAPYETHFIRLQLENKFVFVRIDVYKIKPQTSLPT